MKATRLIAPLKNMLWGIIAIVVAFSLGSCAQKVTFLTSSVVPAAQGYVKVKNDDNKNYVIQVHVSDLAGIERIQPSKQTYVVWMETDQGITKNIGRLNVSNNLKASFETVSSFQPTKIFITAEENESAQYPDAVVVLTTDKFWDDR